MHGCVLPVLLTVHGSVHILFISRDFIVYFYDMVRGYWKLVVALDAKFGGRVFPARMDYHSEP